MISKKIFVAAPLLIVSSVLAFCLSNKKPSEKNDPALRFYYDLKYKANLSSDSISNVLTILDVNDGKQSVYRDYTMIQQDSILKEQMENMRKTGVFVQMEKLVKLPKFGYRISKRYPLATANNVQYIDGIERKLFSYNEKLEFNWEILPDTSTISNYQVQKAIASFGGRKWIAWFTTEIPIQDGPYKFCGLPGLIVKIHDIDEDYSWVLIGNKNLENYNPITYADQLYFGNNVIPKVIPKSKFIKTWTQYKRDPFASIKAQLTKDELDSKVGGSHLTQGEMIESQEKALKEYFSFNNNPIEKIN
jgi:GLPGLI family protein